MRVGEHEAIHGVGLKPSIMNSGAQTNRSPKRGSTVCEILVCESIIDFRETRCRMPATAAVDAGECNKRLSDEPRALNDGKAGLISSSQVNINSSSQRIMRAAK